MRIRILIVVVAALLMASSISGCIGGTVSDVAPIQPGTYADLWPSQGRVPDVSAPAAIRFSNVDGPQPAVVVATPDASTKFAVDGKVASWDSFVSALGESHACGVVVESDGSIALLDARAPLKPGDVINARRVK